MSDKLRGAQGDALGNVIRYEWAEDGTTLLLEAALANIREEISEDYAAGKVRPFIELSLPPLDGKPRAFDELPRRRRGLGEPIGLMQHRRLPTREEESPAERWTRRQQEIKYLREKNDRALARILED